MLILYSKPGCHLCERAHAVLEQSGVTFEERSIQENAELEALYGIDIPVLAKADGTVLLKGVFNESRVAAALLRV